MSARERAAKVGSALVEQGAPSASFFLRALVEALLPRIEEPEESTRLLDQVSAFTSDQVAALPSRLRLLFGAGMLFFRIVTFVRYFRPFTALSPSRRRSWVEKWAYGPWSLGRQLFRPVRSVAIVAYYADATVARSLAETRGAPAAVPERTRE